MKHPFISSAILRRIAAPLCALCLGAAPALASQATLVTPAPPLPMTGLASFLNTAFLSIGSCNSGTSAPANGTGAAAFFGECWANTTTAASEPFAYYDGASWITLGYLNATGHAWTPNGTTGYFIGGNPAMVVVGNYFTVYAPNGDQSIFLGNASDPANYYLGSFHAFETRGSVRYLDIENADLLINTEAAPATPSAGKSRIYVDSSQKVLSNKNDAGAVSVTAYPGTASAHSWFNQLTAGGAFISTQPAFSDLSGTITAGQIASGTLTNAMHSDIPAWTIMGNVTGGSTVPANFTIDGLTNKASPAAGDEVIIWDVAGAAIKKASVSSVGSAGSVSSIAGNTGAFTLGVGLTNAANDIRASLSSVSNSLGADVLLNNTANYFDGPSIAQGTSGTWFVSGTVTVSDTGQAGGMFAKLWDGTTVIASALHTTSAAGADATIALSGVITSPAGNLRISVKDNSTTNGVIKFNITGNSKDSTITAVRIQ